MVTATVRVVVVIGSNLSKCLFCGDVSSGNEVISGSSCSSLANYFNHYNHYHLHHYHNNKLHHHLHHISYT